MNDQQSYSQWISSSKPLGNWDKLLQSVVKSSKPLFRLSRWDVYSDVPVVNGDILRITYTADTDNGPTVIRVGFEMLFSTSIHGFYLLVTEDGLVHVALEDRNASQVFWYELPSVWQYHDCEDNDALSVSERREQEVPLVYAMAEMPWDPWMPS